MKDKLDILMRYYKYGESIKKITKSTKLSRNTIRSYIREFEEKRKMLIEKTPDLDTLSIIDSIVEKPKYDSNSRPTEVMDTKYIRKIEQFLDNNNFKRENGMKKQCMNAMDIHKALIDEGYRGSYSTTCNYVRKLKENTKEAFIKQIYEFGDVCEFDWGEVKLMRANEIKVYKMAVFTSAKLNARIAFLYRKENMQAFVDSHVRFFEYTNGVYRTMVYDNMKVAVAKFVGVAEKEATEELKKMSLFYGFNYRFCNVNSGNEKGHVERSVDVVRHMAFSNRIDYSFEEAIEHLEKVLKATNENKFEEENQYLLPCPGKYEAADIKECFVDKYSSISYLTNKYSVPDNLVGKYVCLKAYINEIIIFYSNEKVAIHKRLHGKHEWSLNIYHYLRTISRKPGALKGSLALSQLQEDLKGLYIKYFESTPKEFIKLLEFIGEIGKNKVFKKINELIEMKVAVTFDNIKAAVLCQNEPVRNDIKYIEMLSGYDHLYGKGGENNEYTDRKH